MPNRYVILHHRQQAGEHWDLMLEQEGVMWTWQLAGDPTMNMYPIPARRIADHRLAYLTYEGPISGDRGHVRRVDAGEFQLVRGMDGALHLRLNGECLVGAFQLSAPDDEGCSVFDASL